MTPEKPRARGWWPLPAWLVAVVHIAIAITAAAAITIAMALNCAGCDGRWAGYFLDAGVNADADPGADADAGANADADPGADADARQPGSDADATHPDAGPVPELCADEPGWPQVGYNARRTGYNPCEQELGVSNVGALQVLWWNQVSSTINTGPSVVDGLFSAL